MHFKASIVGDKLVINGRQYMFNKIPIKWRPDQPQFQQNEIYDENAPPSEHEI